MTDARRGLIEVAVAAGLGFVLVLGVGSAAWADGNSALPGVVTADAPSAPPVIASAAFVRTEATPGGMPTRTLKPVFDAAGRPIAVYEATSLNPDCTTMGALVFRVDRKPQHGTISIVRTSIFTHYPPSNTHSVCNSRRAPGYRVLYRADKGFTGNDTAEFEVFWPNGAALDLTLPVKVE